MALVCRTLGPILGTARGSRRYKKFQVNVCVQLYFAGLGYILRSVFCLVEIFEVQVVVLHGLGLAFIRSGLEPHVQKLSLAPKADAQQEPAEGLALPRESPQVTTTDHSQDTSESLRSFIKFSSH